MFCSSGVETTLEMKDGKAIQGASDLTMKSNSTVGEDMFEMSGGKDKSKKVKFGFAKIVELTSDGEKVEKVGTISRLFLNCYTFAHAGLYFNWTLEALASPPESPTK